MIQEDAKVILNRIGESINPMNRKRNAGTNFLIGTEIRVK